MPPAKRPSLAVLIDRQRDSLDRLAAEIAGGVRGPDHFDRLEDQANAIGTQLRAAFRERR